jgi:stage II sporulation protein GA (sporulation sigma-E factor processing peptidase)
LISVVLAFIFGRVFRSKNKTKSTVVTAAHGKKFITFEGLVDSGNLLRDPLSGMPVIITNLETLKGVLPEELQTVFERHDTEALYKLGFDSVRRVRIIPMSSVGYSGVIMAFMPEKLIVDGNAINACIAADTLQMNNDYGGFEAVVPVSLVD